MTERLRKITFKNKEILIVDYADCNESGMIEVLMGAKDLLMRENKKFLVLSIFNRKNYVSRKFIKTFEKEVKDVEHLISKNAITGISEVQRWIVKGINLWYKRQIVPFNSIDEALEFLVS